MDISEALRNEDLSKADFFDFVACPELSESGRLMRGSPPGTNGFVDSLQDMKETNNNHLPATDSLEHLLWNNNVNTPANGDIKTDTVKLETAIFGCEDWNKLWGHAVVTTEPVGSTPAQRNNNNTDGAIYTLTVLNGESTNQNWFAPKPEDQLPQQEIESLLNIMAPTNGFRSDSMDLGNSPSAATTFNYPDESSVASTPCTTSTPSNTSTTTTTSSDPLLNVSDESYHNSLLRSALQGKASFHARRYNIKFEQDCDEVTAELGHTNGVSELVVPSPIDSTRADSSPGGNQNLFAATGVLPSMFDHQNLDSEPSAHSMEELLLSQLDVTYDYEKLRRIEDEVAESVQQYCSRNTDDTIYKLENGVQQPPSQPVAAPPTKSKKYSKRSKASAEKANNAANAIANGGVRKERSLHYCTICSKGFKDKYSVNVHIRTHTGEKPFACTICGKSFRQKAHLAKHYQTHAQKTLSNSPNHKSSKR